MTNAIDLLEGHAKHRRQFYSETASLIHSEYAAEYEQAASILRGYGKEPAETGEPIAPEMQDDPRFLRLLVATLETGLNVKTGDDFATQSALESATVTFNSLFPKP